MKGRVLMLYDALRSVLLFVRTVSKCLESLDQTAVMHCADRQTVIGPTHTDDACISLNATFDTAITVGELRVRLGTLEKYLEQILRGIYKA